MTREIGFCAEYKDEKKEGKEIPIILQPSVKEHCFLLL